MSLPRNGIFVVRGEISTLMTAMRRGSRWNSATYVDDEKDGLLKLFVDLKQILNRTEDLRHIDPHVFLGPFLEVIRTDETTGTVTSLALAAINKFLSYGLIDPTSPNLPAIVDNIVDTVTHARFMGTDQSSDGVTLYRVVEVLHTLMRSPEGLVLTNESVCEVMLSCFKICFEPRLNELLRRSAEQALKDMVLLLFMRLPQFSEDQSESGVLKKFQMIASSIESNTKQRKKSQKSQASATLQRSSSQRSEIFKHEDGNPSVESTSPENTQSHYCLNTMQLKAPPLATTPATPAGNILDMQGKITRTPTTPLGINNTEEIKQDQTLSETYQHKYLETRKQSNSLPIDVDCNTLEVSNEPIPLQVPGEPTTITDSSEYINSVGVRFTQQISSNGTEVASLLPYGMPCIQELFRFLILLCNPLDKQNTDTMIHMGISLLSVAFEVSADNIGKYNSLLELIKDDLCRNLISLMSYERLTIFAAALQLCFLLFESLRGHLKFQLEAFLKKLSEIIASDNPKTPYEMRELALDILLQLWRIPGFVAELYINYDCDLYCTDIFENLTNLLSKHTLSATSAIYSTHIAAMDTLISVIEGIERNCIATKTTNRNTGIMVSDATPNQHSRQSSELDGIVIDTHSVGSNESQKPAVENISKFMNSTTRLRLPSGGAMEACITREHLRDVKQKKRILMQGTELFNFRPEKGIQYLQENGILSLNMNAKEVASFLRENPGLDKKMIGECISKKKNVDSKILQNFVESFDFTGLRVDQALRLYLETFRLPGEAPLIFLVLEHFADHWHKQNGEPFANTDAAFSLAYAIIMLNMDQHNSNAKRLNVPMTPEDFLKNLRGLNGGVDFDQDMLLNVFNAIKNQEIVMPAEQTGIVRENYLWKVLLRRGQGPDGVFNYVHESAYDMELFNIIWRASLSALSFMFDKSTENGYQRTLAGFTKCAAISAHYNLFEDFDALVLTLCKFTTLLNITQQDTSTPAQNEIVLAVNFGLNPKAQSAMRTVFMLVHDYGDYLRESWKNILDLYLQLFRLKLLPKSLMEVEDFCELSGKAVLVLDKPNQKHEAGLFSSLYSYLSSEGQREPTYEEQEFIRIGKKCIKDCQLDQIVQESKFVKLESLRELLKSILSMIKAPTAHKSVEFPYPEDIVVFWMELLVKVVVQNRDRMIPLWPSVRDQMFVLLIGGASYGYDYLLNRSIVAVLKLAIYLMRNEELCPIVLQSLKMLLMLKTVVMFRISRHISIGIYELLKTSAQNIHSEEDWQIIFTILECVGAGAEPPDFGDTSSPDLHLTSAKSDGALSSEEDSGLPDKGYLSESEVTSKIQKNNHHQIDSLNTNTPFVSSSTTENWILVNKDNDLAAFSRPQSPPSSTPLTSGLPTLIYNCRLIEHSPFALFKCWDSLAFIVRNVAHITPYNFQSCVRCIRTFVEACRDGGVHQHKRLKSLKNVNSELRKKNKRSDRENVRKLGNAEQCGNESQNDDEDDALAQRYETLSIQLLDLMYTLYTRTAQIFRWWAEEGCSVPQCSALWAQGWCPLLQGIARLAMDRRREVRTYAISCLQQRALLVHDLQTLSGIEWASCFRHVLFPLLNELLPESESVVDLDSQLLEESRIRIATIMSKVFLHHLTPLIELGDHFNDLWIEVLDYIEKFMEVGSDMLSEQMQEILKNMLLVMHSVKVFHNDDGALREPLWTLTWNRIEKFLPNLKNDLFCNEGHRAQFSSTPTHRNGEVMDVAAIPQIAVLLKSQQQQPGKQNETPNSTRLHMESPKHSILLQPPDIDLFQSQSVVFGQVSPQQNIPIVVPQLSHTMHPLPTTTSIRVSNSVEISGSCMASRPIYSNISSTILPDLINDTSKGSPQLSTSSATPTGELTEKPQVQEREVPLQRLSTFLDTNETCNSSSFAIELPETPPPTSIYGESNQLKNLELQNEDGFNHHDEYGAKTIGKLQEQNINSLYGIENENSDTIPNIPASHLLAGNEYPSLSKPPNSAIVQSFVPVYMQVPSPQPGADIYQEYIQNPYNLTLQKQQYDEKTLNRQHHQNQQTPQHSEHIFASSSNYFNANVDPNSIPPGSEMLYSQP